MLQAIPMLTMNKYLSILLLMLLCGGVGEGQSAASAQTYAQLKVWDSHERYPKINEIEFEGADSALATYDAIYGHGAMMENDFYGLRVYMDHRQSIDLYGKRTPQLELAITNFYSTPQHMAQGYGEDILFVGPSIGAGSFRGYENEQPVTIQSVAARGQRVVCAGPDSAVIEVWDRDWIYKGQRLQMVQRYTMRAGSRVTDVDIQLTGCTDETLFATGVQKLESDNQSLLLPARGLVASWGSNIPDKAHPQLVERLGIAVHVPAPYLYGVREDSHNLLCLVHPVGGHIRYRLLVAPDMEQNDGFHSAAQWFAHLQGLSFE